VTADRVVLELARVAFGDPRRVAVSTRSATGAG
jgi:hypothetical protein